MSEKYIDLADRIMAATATTPNTTRASAIGDTLEWLDRNFDQVPGRTITESEVDLAVAEVFGSDWRAEGPCKVLLGRLGLTVVPDPEPTNAEKLRDAITNAAHGVGIGSTTANIKAIAEHLDAAGVKAPGGDE